MLRVLRHRPLRQGTRHHRKAGEGSKGRRSDVWLLDYPPGAGIPEHVDPIANRRHLRINAALLTGGSRLIADSSILRLGRLAVFWSDRPHRVTRGTGRRVVLSIGVAL